MLEIPRRKLLGMTMAVFGFFYDVIRDGTVMGTHLIRCRQWFDGYTRGFLTGDDALDLPLQVKIEHTAEVQANMARLATALDGSAEDRVLAEMAGLLHDVGRFPQYRRYHTFRDSASVNHARLGLQEIGRHRVLDGLPTAARRELAFAIAHHNAFVLPPHPDRRRVLLARMLRDADKLDIWRVFKTYYCDGRRLNATLDLDLADTPGYTPAALESLRRGRMVRLADVHNRNDFKLLQIAWIHDLNLAPSFALMRDQGHLAALAGTLPRDPALCRVVEDILDYAAARATDETPSNL
jgi:putative nucleotidyltransferase with HDIG domain